MNRGNVFLTGLLTGALAGLVTGLMLAPKPGREIREFIGSRADEIRDRAGNYIENVRERFQGEQEG